jgi:uncharacterized protein
MTMEGPDIGFTTIIGAAGGGPGVALQDDRIREEPACWHTCNICILKLVADELGFDWDDANTEHIARHEVTPEEAEQVILNGPVEIDYQFIDGEERFVAVGMTSIGRFLTIIWTDRDGLIRIVTAFDSTEDDQSVYLSERGL